MHPPMDSCLSSGGLCEFQNSHDLPVYEGFCHCNVFMFIAHAYLQLLEGVATLAPKYFVALCPALRPTLYPTL
jgi:hypothetical protein